jgi:hypothetical protein
MMDEYWVVDAGGNQFAVAQENMPTALLPPTERVELQQVWEPNTLVWLLDMDESPVGFRFGALTAVWWSTPEIRAHNRRMASESEGPEWER